MFAASSVGCNDEREHEETETLIKNSNKSSLTSRSHEETEALTAKLINTLTRAVVVSEREREGATLQDRLEQAQRGLTRQSEEPEQQSLVLVAEHEQQSEQHEQDQQSVVDDDI